MKDLPYFLMLVKKNAILWTIITTNSFANVDLKNTVHGFWTNQCLEIKNFSLSQDEKFSSIKITITDSFTLIDFFTSSDKYLKNTKFYFDKNGFSDSLSPYSIDDTKISSIQKKLGEFDMGLDLPVDVTVINSSIYGNSINITTYKKDWLEKVDKMKDIDPFEH
jgi:hypothetical protein